MSTAIVNYVASGAQTGLDTHLVSSVDDLNSDFVAQLSSRMNDIGQTLTLLPRTGKFEGRAGRWGISAPLIKWLKRNVTDYDVVVMHGAWMFSSVGALAAARIAKKPSLLIPHESMTRFDIEKPGNAARIAAKKTLKAAYIAYCDHFLFTSQLEAGESLPPHLRSRSSVVPYPLFGHDLPPVRLSGDSGNSERLGFIGRIDPKKNIDVLLFALSRLPDRFTLRIGGSGVDALETELRDLARNLGVEKRVVWDGFIAPGQKDSFFEKIDLLVMPSAFESFGIVAAEAMIRGIPAIVSRRTGIAEIIERDGGGMIIEPEPDAIARAVETLSANRDLRARLAGAASHAARTRLSHAAVGARLGEVLRRVAREGPMQ